MTDLLHYYERELAWLKQAGSDFAAAYPAVAANLNLRDDVVEDPHVSRLIESVAFMNARIHQRLDDDFPQISNALLEQLHPQYLAPVPAMTIVELVPNDDDKPQTIEAHSVICTAAVNGVSCQFRTAYAVTLLPLRLARAQLLSHVPDKPAGDFMRNAMSVLTLELQSIGDFNFSACNVDVLRLFLHASQYAWPLHELLTDHCVHIAISDRNGAIAYLAAEQLRIAGFNTGETLMPPSPGTPAAFQHLADFLHFPQKFLFLDLHGLAAATVNLSGALSLHFYLDSSNRELERNLDASFFSLTATPVVNLFQHLGEPVALSTGTVDHPIVVDARHRDAYEVYAIEHMTHIDESSGRRSAMAPFYGLTHANRDISRYWHHHRKLCRQGNESGFDSFVTFSDIARSDLPDLDAIVQPTLLCSNRNLPMRLGPGMLEFRLRRNSGRVRQIRSLLPMTAPVRRHIDNGALWRLLSHINTSLCGLGVAGDATESLREILRLHTMQQSPMTAALVAAIEHVQLESLMLPVRSQGRTALCRGTDICITFNDAGLAGASLTLYANVLAHFLAQSAAINAFVRLSTRRTSKPCVIKHWPLRAGTRPLL